MFSALTRTYSLYASKWGPHLSDAAAAAAAGKEQTGLM
jgi:hypothetical protein